jgi:predicted kinase
MKILYILRGLPGSGKSTLAKSLSNALTGHIEADMFFVDKESGEYRFDPTKLGQAHSWCKETAEKWMGPHGLDTIIVSNTFTQEWELTPYFELAEKYGYAVFSLIVENRHGGVNEHGVPEEKLIQMENRLQNSIKLR